MKKRNYTHVQALLPEIRAMLAEGKTQRPKGRPRKDTAPRDIVAEQAYEIQRLRMENQLLRDFLRCTGSEGKGKISHHLSSQNRVSSGRHVRILRSIQKRLLCLRPSPGQAGKGCGSRGAHRTAAGTQLPHLRLPADVAVAERAEYLPQSQNRAADHEEI